MTLQLSELELSISRRLEPLRLALLKFEIPVACLPKEAGAYSEEEIGSINIIIPSVSASGNDPTALTAQDVEINVVIRMSLGKRYQDVPGEVAVLEWACDQVTGLLLGFYPYDEEIMKRPLYFQGYELFRPNGDRWEGELRFGCVKQIRALPFEDNYEVMSVQLYNFLDLISGTLVKQIP